MNPYTMCILHSTVSDPQLKPSVAQCDYKGSTEKLRESTQDFLTHTQHTLLACRYLKDNGWKMGPLEYQIVLNSWI